MAAISNIRIVQLNMEDMETQMKPYANRYEEYFEVTKQVDHCINNFLHELRKLEKTCLDKKLLKYFANLQYEYNQITGWREEVDRGVGLVSEKLTWWYPSSLDLTKKIISRLKKNPSYRSLYTKAVDYQDRMKHIIKSPRYGYL